MAKTKQVIDPVIIQLSEMFTDVISRDLTALTATAFCINLAKIAMGWELAGNPEQARKAICKAISP